MTRAILLSLTLASSLWAIAVQGMIQVDERAYRAPDTRAYLVQYSYYPAAPDPGGCYAAQATVLEIKGENLSVFRKIKAVRYCPHKPMDPETRLLLDSRKGKGSPTPEAER